MTIDDLSDYLKRSGPLTATAIAETTGLEIERTYELLVSLESKGLVRVNVDCRRAGGSDRGSDGPRTWESMV